MWTQEGRAMRSAEEVWQAAADLAWYIATGGLVRQGVETRNNLIGVVAALEWVQGEEGTSPITQTLADIRRARATAEG